jgi:hypothetical protein
MSRVRLTQRSKRAADMGIPYPGNVNQPDRTDPDWEQYHTFEQQVNHELPDMRHDWKNDERDDIGFGVSEPWGQSPTVPTVASVRVAANKAVRIAVLLLGEKVEDEVIEAQARDLMSLSQTAMDRTLARFAETQKLYADDDDEGEEEAEKKEAKSKKSDDEEDEDEAEEKKEAKSKKSDDEEEEKAEPEKKADDEDEDKADEKKEAKSKNSAEEGEVKPGAEEAEKKATSKKAELPPELKENAQKMKEHAEKKEDKKASKELAEKADAEKKSDDEEEEKAEPEKKAEDKPAEEKPVEEEKEAKKAQDDEDDEEEEVVAKKASPNEMDIELSAAADEDEEEMTPETAAQLASLFEGKDGTAADEELPEKKEEASKKAGIRKLGGQPKVASASGDGTTDISSIWESAPDVSDVFK